MKNNVHDLKKTYNHNTINLHNVARLETRYDLHSAQLKLVNKFGNLIVLKLSGGPSMFSLSGHILQSGR